MCISVGGRSCFNPTRTPLASTPSNQPLCVNIPEIFPVDGRRREINCLIRKKRMECPRSLLSNRLRPSGGPISLFSGCLGPSPGVFRKSSQSPQICHPDGNATHADRHIGIYSPQSGYIDDGTLKICLECGRRVISALAPVFCPFAVRRSSPPKSNPFYSSSIGKKYYALLIQLPLYLRV
jgi:hypothetical protein